MNKYITIMWKEKTDEEVYILTEALGWFEAEDALDQDFENFRSSDWVRGSHFHVSSDSSYLNGNSATMSAKEFIEKYG